MLKTGNIIKSNESRDTKYKHVILAASEDITPLEAKRLASEKDDDILSVLTLNKSPSINTSILKLALVNATAETVKKRITRSIEERYE